mmetsp:Transcript_54498/g.117078  ORF Transcript_54498/g.117078 Transcript_54498/m.117078 type:complete len:193 (-) Transcript_54498:192-770(-)
MTGMEITVFYPVKKRSIADFAQVFPDGELSKQPTEVGMVVSAVETTLPMQNFSPDMIEERHQHAKEFIERAQPFCDAVKAEGVWADFVDPINGTPFYSSSSTTLSETDGSLSQFGFQILELGCCRALKHKTFMTRVLACVLCFRGDRAVVDKHLHMLEKSQEAGGDKPEQAAATQQDTPAEVPPEAPTPAEP